MPSVDSPGHVVDAMLLAVERVAERLVAVDARQRADAVRRQKLVLVEHVAQHALEPLARREWRAGGGRGVAGSHVRDMPGPGRAGCRGTTACACEKPGRRSSVSCSSTSTAKQRHESDQRADAQRHLAAVGVQLVVVEAVLLVPQPGAAERVHRVGDGDEVLEELRRDVLVGRVLLRQLERHREHAWRSRRPSRRCRRPAPGGRRSAAACERSKTPMLSSPRKPPREEVACRRRPCDSPTR